MQWIENLFSNESISCEQLLCLLNGDYSCIQQMKNSDIMSETT